MWISVKDRMLELKQRVIVFDGEEVLIDFLYERKFYHKAPAEIVWGNSLEDTVTHWMPLPEKPHEPEWGNKTRIDKLLRSDTGGVYKIFKTGDE